MRIDKPLNPPVVKPELDSLAGTVKRLQDEVAGIPELKAKVETLAKQVEELKSLVGEE